MPTLGAIEPTQPRVNALLDHGQWTHKPDVRDPLPTATGLSHLFQMLAHSARLPGEPLHIPTWRQAGCLTFHLQLSHVLRVGHLLALKAWRSLLYPSPARLPMC